MRLVSAVLGLEELNFGPVINTQSCKSQAEDDTKGNRIKIENNTRPPTLVKVCFTVREGICDIDM